jgi:hypothetical protein
LQPVFRFQGWPIDLFEFEAAVLVSFLGPKLVDGASFSLHPTTRTKDRADTTDENRRIMMAPDELPAIHCEQPCSAAAGHRRAMKFQKRIMPRRGLQRRGRPDASTT